MSLFDKDDRYTEEATELDNKTNDAIKDIFADFISRGYSPREISYTMKNAITDCELGTLI